MHIESSGDPGLDTTDMDRARLYDDLLGGELLGLFRTSLTGRLLDCNQALAHLLGYNSIEELKKVPVEGLYFDLAERQEFIEQLLEKKRLNNYELLLKHRNGRSVHVLENVILREAPGRASVMEGVLIDITAVRQSELEQRVLANNYRQLTEHMKDGIVLVQQGKVVYTNRAAESLLALIPSSNVQFLDLIEDRDIAIVKDLLRRAEAGEEVETDRVHFQVAGQASRPLLLNGTASWHMNAAAIQLTLHDGEAQRNLMQERLRATMAEEMNAVLRKEIDEHQRTQEALVKSRRMSKSLIDSSLDMIVAVDPNGSITEFNPAAVIKFGYEVEEVVGKSSRILYKDQQEFERVQQEMARYGAYAGEVQNITKEGKVFVSFIAASRLFDEDGQALGSMGVSRDVTQAKRDREALRLSEERYRDLVDNATDLIHSVDAEGRILFTNTAWKQTLGYNEEDLAHMHVFDLIAPDQREAARQWLKQDPENMDPNPWRSIFITKDGRELLLEGTSTVRKEEGRAIAVRSIFRDITAAHAAQEQLLKHAAKEKALFEASEHIFWTVDRRIALTSFNQGYQNMVKRLHGTTPRINLDPLSPRELFAPREYHDFWQAKYEEVFKGETVRFETDLIDVNGQRVCNMIYLSPVLDADGNVEEAFGIAIEVTAERVAEAKVQEQAARLNAIFESSANMMIWSLDTDYRITACNKHFQEVVKQSLDLELDVGDNMRDRVRESVPAEVDLLWVEQFNALLAGKAQHEELRFERPDGVIWIEAYMSPIITDGEITGASCLAHDITEKKRAEQEMRASLQEKEVLLKEVHHRVKNNLQIISSIFSLQRDHVGGDPRSISLLHESQDRIRSMSFIHESLYQNTNFTQVDFAQYIEGLCSNLVMSYSLSGRVLLQTDLVPLMLDLDKAIPCGLVLNELISNALKHAFTDGRKGVINIDLLQENERVRIRVVDDGQGFPKDYDEERDRGLGMELVELLMNQLDGNVERVSRAGEQGTTYLITFERS
ncbi:MAG: PAS domain S-box protein [Flavobacteriales bacterium]